MSNFFNSMVLFLFIQLQTMVWGGYKFRCIRNSFNAPFLAGLMCTSTSPIGRAADLTWVSPCAMMVTGCADTHRQCAICYAVSSEPVHAAPALVDKRVVYWCEYKRSDVRGHKWHAPVKEVTTFSLMSLIKWLDPPIISVAFLSSCDLKCVVFRVGPFHWIKFICKIFY